MAPENDNNVKSKYTADRGWPGSFEGETVTRRGFMTGAAMTFGGLATAAFALPALGFALGPVFEPTVKTKYQDIGPERDFVADTYVPKVITLVAGIGEAGKTTIYVRKNLKSDREQPYIAISTRCAHLGCPVRFVQAARQFICPCHGGTYNFEGQVTGGPPVRPLDRFYTKVDNGRVFVGQRFSVNSQLEKLEPRDPGEWIDGYTKYLYPQRPTT